MSKKSKELICQINKADLVNDINKGNIGFIKLKGLQIYYLNRKGS